MNDGAYKGMFAIVNQFQCNTNVNTNDLFMLSFLYE